MSLELRALNRLLRYMKSMQLAARSSRLMARGLASPQDAAG